MNVICIQLPSGVEIIGRQVEQKSLLVESETAQDTGTITLEKIRVIGLQEVPGGKLAVSFFPWAVGNSDAAITFHEGRIVTSYVPEKTIEDGYMSQTSPIVTSAGPAIKI